MGDGGNEQGTERERERERERDRDDSERERGWVREGGWGRVCV